MNETQFIRLLSLTFLGISYAEGENGNTVGEGKGESGLVGLCLEGRARPGSIDGECLAAGRAGGMFVFGQNFKGRDFTLSIDISALHQLKS